MLPNCTASEGNTSLSATNDVVLYIMVEGYTGNNYAPPQGTLFAVVAFSKGDIEASKYS